MAKTVMLEDMKISDKAQVFLQIQRAISGAQIRINADKMNTTYLILSSMKRVLRDERFISSKDVEAITRTIEILTRVNEGMEFAESP